MIRRDPDSPLSGARVFISYRRSDGLEMAIRLERTIERTWPIDSAFRDESDAVGAVAWKDRIHAQLGKADVVLVLITPDWSGPRLLDSSDILRREVAWALESRAVVIPLLVDGVRMPAPEDLPAEIRQLAALQARELRAASFTGDLARVQYDLLRLLDYRATQADAATRMLDDLNRRIERGEDVDLDAVFGAEVRQLPRFIAAPAPPHLGLHEYEMNGVWLVRAKRREGDLELHLTLAQGKPFEGQETVTRFLGLGRKTREITGSWYPVLDTDRDVLHALHLDGIREGRESFQLTIPMHRRVGERIVGTDAGGVTWVSHNIAPRSGGF